MGKKNLKIIILFMNKTMIFVVYLPVFFPKSEVTSSSSSYMLHYESK